MPPAPTHSTLADEIAAASASDSPTITSASARWSLSSGILPTYFLLLAIRDLELKGKQAFLLDAYIYISDV